MIWGNKIFIDRELWLILTSLPMDFKKISTAKPV
jgi:hypothetical protein